MIDSNVVDVSRESDIFFAMPLSSKHPNKMKLYDQNCARHKLLACMNLSVNDTVGNFHVIPELLHPSSKAP